MATQMILRGVSAPAGSPFRGESWPNVGGNTLYAAYLFGDQQKMPYSDGYDYSFHDRNLALVGTPPRGNGYSVPTSAAYYSCPFTDTALMAAGVANEWTYCGVAKANGSIDGTLFSAEHASDLAGFRAWISSSGTFSPHAYDADGPSGSANPTIAASVDNGEFEFFAVSFKATEVKSYRKGNTAAMATATAVPSPGIVASGKGFLLGRRTPNTSTTGGISKVGDAFYNRVLTPSEIENVVYARIKAFLAAQPYAISI